MRETWRDFLRQNWLKHFFRYLAYRIRDFQISKTLSFQFVITQAEPLRTKLSSQSLGFNIILNSYRSGKTL